MFPSFCMSISDYDRIGAVDLRESHVNALTMRCLDILAYVIGANRNFALSAIDQHRELNRLRTAEVRDGVERGTHGSPGIQHVVNQHDPLGVQRKRNIAAEQPWIAGQALAIVAIGRNIKRADRNLALTVGAQLDSDPLGERGAAPDDTDQHHVVGAAVALGNLHRYPLQRPPNLRGVEQDVGCSAHRDTQKKSRLQKQPGPQMYTFIVVPFRYLSSGLKVFRIYDRDGGASTPRSAKRQNYAPRLRSSFRRR